ncbi:MAG: DNA polymerase III subunit gamma/tau [Candidatus Eremiobacteraeota bacterium]|nr:DNA polymerase III subunit gamma/tau [Candidatus Eremiobacteraeota bacterium]
MSLYRTWRPLTFADLVGQDAVVRTLTAALEGGKLAHAYLFSGPRGSGKTSAAKILARCIDCVKGPTAQPDNSCENCRAILAGTALDVLEIDAASNRGIDEIRALREAVKFAPASMRMKVYIIDEAHMLTKEGANAFLKTLEEPPPHAVFVLATTEPEKLPVTVLSRCQRYAFRRIAIPVMIEKMREIARGENIAIDEGALAAIAYRADGGLRDALTMLEQAAAFAGGETVTVATLDLAFGATGRNFAQSLCEAALARDAAAVLTTIEEASDAGTDMNVLVRALIAAFRNLLVARVDPELLARDLAPEDAQRAAQRSRDVSQATLVRVLRVLTEAASLARSGANPRLELETALLRFVLAAEDPTLDALAARVASLEERPASGPAAAPAAQPAPAKTKAPPPQPAATPEPSATPIVVGPLSLQRVRAAWQSIRGKVESERQSLRAPLSRAAIESLEGDDLVLKLPDAWSADALRDHAASIENAIADVLGSRLRVTLRVDGSAGASGRAKGSAPGGVASVTAEAPQAEDADELFSYANERIKEKS